MDSEGKGDWLDNRLLQAQRIEMTGKLAVGLAHDIGNMLTPIVGYSHMIANGLPSESHLDAYVRQIQQATEAAADLVHQITSLSDPELTGSRLTNLNHVILGMDNVLRRIVGNKIDLVICLAPELGMASMNMGQIQRILVNLVFNARDAMLDGGTLTIQTTNVTLDDEGVRFPTQASGGDYIMIAVGDTGLGLAMCLSIVRGSGGHITVDSEPGQGSCFKIYLPRSDNLPVT